MTTINEDDYNLAVLVGRITAATLDTIGENTVLYLSVRVHQNRRIDYVHVVFWNPLLLGGIGDEAGIVVGERVTVLGQTQIRYAPPSSGLDADGLPQHPAQPWLQWIAHTAWTSSGQAIISKSKAPPRISLEEVEAAGLRLAAKMEDALHPEEDR